MRTRDVTPFLLEDIEFEPGHSLVLTDWDAVTPVFQAAGREGSGYTWEGIARLLIDQHLPDKAAQLEHDSESGMFAVYSSQREVLEDLGILLRDLYRSPERLAAFLASADPDLFDD